MKMIAKYESNGFVTFRNKSIYYLILFIILLLVESWILS